MIGSGFGFHYCGISEKGVCHHFVCIAPSLI